ncbi:MULTISPECIES: hypothetical protein [Xanthomonas]|uniref:hypothetical protein n=1 Tax=Xanthomonas TaxID=338 RepID=UPI000B0F30A0|nr:MULTISPECIES: hypothetical protein [Xanthomonas]
MKHRVLAGCKVPMSLLAIALLALAPCSLMAAAPTLPGAGFELERYHVQLHPDLSTTALFGKQRSSLRSTSDHLTQLTLMPPHFQHMAQMQQRLYI